MIREVDLVSYLPPFMAEFKEVHATLEAENPEFRLVWDAANRVFSNEFIATADEYGISRFESLLKISPSNQDTLETRRMRVQNRWFNELPYTMKVLIRKLVLLCGETNFILNHNFTEGYTLILRTALDTFGQVNELDNLLTALLPCAIVIDSKNIIPCDAEGEIFINGGTLHTGMERITNDGFYRDTMTNTLKVGAIPIGTVHVAITNDYKAGFTIKGEQHTGGGVASTERATISNSFNERFEIKNPLKSGVGVTITEISTQRGD